MATIRRAAGDGQRRARKTVAFDGTAGNGAVGTVTLFTVTGRVVVRTIVAHCTETCTGATATWEVGVVGATAAFHGGVTATNIANGDFVGPGGDFAAQIQLDNGGQGNNSGSINKPISANIVGTVGTAAITNGTLVYDVWYDALTDNGALS